MKTTITRGGILAALLLSATITSAQDPAPTPRPQVEISLHGGAMQFLERGVPDRKDFVYRLALTVPLPGAFTLFGRADYTRTQDGGDPLDPKSFRSIEGLVGGRKEFAPGFSVTGFGGVSWDRDKTFDPVDPRLYTVAGGLRFAVPGRGYAVATAGHHGPVGGLAFLGSAVYEINSGAAWFGDVACPIGSDRFIAMPCTFKFGLSARLKGWKF